MNRTQLYLSALIIPLVLMLNLSGCAGSLNLSDGIKQYSTISLLQKGFIQGKVTFAELKGYSDFGIGATSGLKGSITVNDNKGYVNTSGTDLEPISRSQTISYGVFTKFDADNKYSLLNPRSREDVEDYIDRRISTKNLSYAIRLQGKFPRLVLRNYSAKGSPERTRYISEDSGRHELKNLTGVLVGFRFPSDLRSSHPDRYHFHFISNHNQVGGHVEDFRFEEGSISVDQKKNLNIRLPDTTEFKGSQMN